MEYVDFTNVLSFMEVPQLKFEEIEVMTKHDEKAYIIGKHQWEPFIVGVIDSDNFLETLETANHKFMFQTPEKRFFVNGAYALWQGVGTSKHKFMLRCNYCKFEQVDSQTVTA